MYIGDELLELKGTIMRTCLALEAGHQDEISKECKKLKAIIKRNHNIADRRFFSRCKIVLKHSFIEHLNLAKILYINIKKAL